MNLRDYQKQAALKAAELLNKGKVPYLAMEVRTGKTLTAFAAAYLIKAKNVLFVTRLKAISSIREDYNMLPRYFDLHIINYDSLHKISGNWDLVIIDEAHSLGAFPKPSLRTKRLKELINNANVILMSGTPNPESYSQLYHQFWVAGNKSPFADYKTFYKWAQIFVTIREKRYNGVKIIDYAKANKELIQPVLDELFISISQKEADFNQEVKEEIITIPQDTNVQRLIDRFLKDNMFTFKDDTVILGDTGAKKMLKVHQLSSGTVKTENGIAKKLTSIKAEYIKNNYQNKKIAIYYVYIAEGEILRSMFPNCTDSPEEFNASNDKIFICQIQSGSMGVNLKTADFIIFYNIHYSSLLYWQARARMQSKDRTKDSVIHWLFSQNGIEQKIYDVVMKKKDYTLYYFKRDYENDRTAITNQSDKPTTTKRGLCV